MIEHSTQGEYGNLVKCYNCGMHNVQPIEMTKNVGDGIYRKNVIQAPTLVKTGVDYDNDHDAISIILDLYNKVKIGQADFLEYDIFTTDEGLIVFVLGSPVDIKCPNAVEFLQGDIRNITKFFVKRGLIVDNRTDVRKGIVK